MSLRFDPEGHETEALFALLPEWERARVLEIGCGDGRLTLRYARRAAHVVAIDPDEDDIRTARGQLPPDLTGRVDYRAETLEGFRSRPDERFDIALLSWSL